MNHCDQLITCLVADSISPAVIGLPAWAVRTPMLIIVPLMITISMRAFKMRLSPFFAPKAMPISNRIGSISSVRAAIDGTRKVVIAITPATAQ